MGIKPKFRGGNMAVRNSVVLPERKQVDYSDLYAANRGLGDALQGALSKSKLQEASLLASNQQVYRKP
ncbi:MAG: hypothetical protein OXU45_06070 [Candidatus Melainabacteria bacterium]|nr:hypothetical protein [Candidatus Melainabacteria bacterium]